jgi:peptide/nickel transport system permease protein
VAGTDDNSSTFISLATAPVRWLWGPLATILIASFVLFMALAAAPGDPVLVLLGPHPTPGAIAALRAKLGMDQPLIVQYWHWLSGAVQGDFGTSIIYRTQVSHLLGGRLSTTLFLVVYAAVIVVVVGVGLGILGGAVRRLGPVVATIVAVAVAIPAFVAAMFLVQVFAVQLGWFPTLGAGSGFSDRLWHMTLPAVALAIGASAYVAQITRATIFEEQSREHVEAARGRGLGSLYVFRRHVLRNAAIPIMTVSALTAAALIAGTVVVEYAFGIGGLGSLLVSSVASKDYAVVEAVTLIFLVVFVVTIAIIDLLQRLLDPRIRTRRPVS